MRVPIARVAMRALPLALVTLLALPLAAAAPLATTAPLAAYDVWTGVATQDSRDEVRGWPGGFQACARGGAYALVTLTVLSGADGDVLRLVAGGSSADAAPGAPVTLRAGASDCVDFAVEGVAVENAAAYSVRVCWEDAQCL